MEFGIQVANMEFQRLRDVAQMAEGLGFHSIMLPDHIVAEGPERQAMLEHLAYDPIMQAAVIAEATKRIRVGHLVLCNLFRHPVFTAQAIVSLDHLSRGRAFLGLGTGWTESEFRMTGIPFPEIGARLRMLDEALTCIRGFWTQERTTFDGEFYHLREAVLWPKPVQQPHPPILLGGGGKGLLRIAARHATVVNIISDAGRDGYIKLANVAKFTDAAFRSKVQFLRDEAVRQGRDRKAIKISHVAFQTAFTDSSGAARDMAAGIANMMGGSAEDILRSPIFLIGTPTDMVAELQRRQHDWGLSEAVFSFADDSTLERLGHEVLPHV
jgi:probable F420-dependent oxidoreductase